MFGDTRPARGSLDTNWRAPTTKFHRTLNTFIVFFLLLLLFLFLRDFDFVSMSVHTIPNKTPKMKTNLSLRRRRARKSSKGPEKWEFIKECARKRGGGGELQT